MMSRELRMALPPVPARVTSIDFMSLGSLLLRHKWPLLISAFAGIIISFAIMATLPLKFSSEGALLVEGRQARIPDISPGMTSSSQEKEDLTPTLSAVLGSSGLLKSVASQLDLAHAESLQPTSRFPIFVTKYAATLQLGIQALRHWGEEILQGGGASRHDAANDSVAVSANREADASSAAVKYLQDNLKIETKEHSNLLTIQFRAGSPELAAEVVNRLMHSFVDLDEAAFRNQFLRAREWLLDRAAKVQTEIATNQIQIQKLIQDNDVGEVRDGSMAAQRLSAAQSHFAIAQEELTRRQASLDTARQMAVQSGSAAAAQEALASPTINALMQRQAELLQRLGGGATLSFPAQARLQDELRSVRSQITAEAGKIVSALSRDTEIARANVRALQLTIELATIEARQSSAAQVRFAEMTRDVEAKRQLYDSLILRSDQAQLTTGQLSSTRILFPATPPQRPDRPNLIITALLGFIAGGALAAAIVMLRCFIRDRVSSLQDIASATGVAVFGILPALQAKARWRAKVPVMAQMHSSAAETLRAMWLTIRPAAPDNGCAVVVVTSSEVGEGKTTVAVALARRVAADGFRVMLIDADFRQPHVLDAINLPATGRLGPLLQGKITLANAVTRDPQSGLQCLMAGNDIVSPTKTLASDEFKKLLINLRQNYDLVVLDSPAVLRVADAVLLSQLSEVTLFVVGYGRVSRRLLAEAIGRFPAGCRNKILALLTRVPSRQVNQQGYYSGYGAVVDTDIRPITKPDWAAQSHASAARPIDTILTNKLKLTS